MQSHFHRPLRVTPRDPPRPIFYRPRPPEDIERALVEPGTEVDVDPTIETSFLKNSYSMVSITYSIQAHTISRSPSVHGSLLISAPLLLFSHKSKYHARRYPSGTRSRTRKPQQRHSTPHSFTYSLVTRSASFWFFQRQPCYALSDASAHGRRILLLRRFRDWLSSGAGARFWVRFCVLRIVCA